jgi:endonuclease YncB( thermonuclease family)
MSYRVIHGEYVIKGKQPDADSVRFLPDDPARFDGLEGRPVRLATDGTAQLRFQGVDAPELHYGGSRQPVGKYARNVLLYLMGFGKVRYDGLTVRHVEKRVRGAILTKGAEGHGRPISYLLLDSDLEGLGDREEIPEDSDVAPFLRRTLNYRMIAAGMQYFLAYDSMPEMHRELFREAAVAARSEGLGVWVQDSTSEFALKTPASIGPDGELIFPKLFRRCTDYLLARDQENFTGSFTDWLQAAGPENDVVLAGKLVTTFDKLVTEANGLVSLAADTLDLVFVERLALPPVASPAEAGLAASMAGVAGISPAASAGKRTEVVAHLVTGEDIESALITTGTNPNGFDFTGSPRDQTATVFTNDNGRLVWGLDLETQMSFSSWSLTLTKKGDKEGEPDARGTTDGDGEGGDGGIKKF